MAIGIVAAVLLSNGPLYALSKSTTPVREASNKPSLQGYAVKIASGTAANGAQAALSVSCPSGTVVYGGGVALKPHVRGADVQDSYPASTTAWTGGVNNDSGSAATFNVYAICADEAPGYTMVQTPQTSNPAGKDTLVQSDCPNGTVDFGGGVMTTSSSLSVNLDEDMADGPVQNSRKVFSWIADIDNESSGGNTAVGYSICGNDLKGFQFVPASVSIPGGTDGSWTLSCPTGLVPLSGGGGADAITKPLDVLMNSSYPARGLWKTYFNNNLSSTDGIQGGAVCAK
ncbi:MAG: hypothetical protein WAM97_03140 [Acidimicrobiales bacterium]